MKAKWLSKNVILVLPPEAVIIYDSSGGPRSVVLQEYFSFISIYEFQIKYSFISTSMIYDYIISHLRHYSTKCHHTRAIDE